ncbi:hypothetical protein [Cupriavidus taiwanensis]|uniref:hypothetical protein n=1 Tax=Cupriavidus taiwanensis TaxID=164546 RepID=UPI001F11D16C|nr:hypothetical protein [Cupriavidus taiwanensis]
MSLDSYRFAQQMEQAQRQRRVISADAQFSDQRDLASDALSALREVGFCRGQGKQFVLALLHVPLIAP